MIVHGQEMYFSNFQTKITMERERDSKRERERDSKREGEKEQLPDNLNQR